MIRGFTLIETVIYLSLLSILITGSITTFYTITDTMDREEGTLIAQAEAVFVLEKIAALLRSATAVSVSSDTLTMHSAYGTVSVSEHGGTVMLSRNGHTYPLSTSRVVVGDMNFSEAGGFITVSMVINDTAVSDTYPTP